MRRNYFIILIIAIIFLNGCEQIALSTTPKKKAIRSTSVIAEQAQDYFWQILHQGDYANIPTAEKMLLAAYLENPNDPLIASHLGFLHIWQIAERQRLEVPDPTIVNQIILSNKYFSDAVMLDPQDARLLGFLGVTYLVQGQIFADQRQQVKGYFILKKAIKKWPQFNYFTAGYPMSSLTADSKQFKQGLAWQWKNLDVCAGERVNRLNPDYRPYMHLETHTGPARACWNSWIAPFNFEGFFLNMGDMLVKAGDWQTAIKIYNNAKLADNYSSWPYRQILENRIQNAQQNITFFNQPIDNQTLNAMKEKIIMFNSSFSCMACHQNAS